AMLKFREKQLRRMKELFDAKGIEQRLLDECEERLESALEGERAAKAAVATAKAQVVAAKTRFDQARADLMVAEAVVMVAQATLERSQVQLDFATVKAPLDGVITQRGYSVGDFIRSADKRNNDAPLF